MNMYTFKIVGLRDLEQPQEATNKRYVDHLIEATNENISNKVLVDGTTRPTQDINWNYNKITNLKDQTDNLGAVNKQHWDLTLNEKHVIIHCEMHKKI